MLRAAATERWVPLPLPIDRDRDRDRKAVEPRAPPPRAPALPPLPPPLPSPLPPQSSRPTPSRSPAACRSACVRSPRRGVPRRGVGRWVGFAVTFLTSRRMPRLRLSVPRRRVHAAPPPPACTRRRAVVPRAALRVPAPATRASQAPWRAPPVQLRAAHGTSAAPIEDASSRASPRKLPLSPLPLPPDTPSSPVRRRLARAPAAPPGSPAPGRLLENAQPVLGPAARAPHPRPHVPPPRPPARLPPGRGLPPRLW